MFLYSRREVPRGIDGTPGIEGQADVDGGEAEADERGHEARCHLHVPFICHRQNDDKENRGAEGLVHHQGDASHFLIGVRGKDAGGAVGEVGPDDVVDAVRVGPVKDGGGEEGAQVLRGPVDGEDAPLALPGWGSIQIR